MNYFLSAMCIDEIWWMSSWLRPLVIWNMQIGSLNRRDQCMYYLFTFWIMCLTSTFCVKYFTSVLICMKTLSFLWYTLYDTRAQIIKHCQHFFQHLGQCINLIKTNKRRHTLCDTFNNNYKNKSRLMYQFIIMEADSTNAVNSH